MAALQHAKAAAEAVLTAAHQKALAAQEEALRAASDKSLAAAEAVHRQQVEQLGQQLSAARALACTTEDSAAQQAAQLQQQLHQQQQLVLQLEQQVKQLRCELQQAAEAQQAASATQVHTHTTGSPMRRHYLAPSVLVMHWQPPPAALQHYVVLIAVCLRFECPDLEIHTCV